MELIEEKKKADAAREIKLFAHSKVKILNGRYGPYITDGTKNARVPKDVAPETLDLAQCESLLESAPARRGGKKARPRKT